MARSSRRRVSRPAPAKPQSPAPEEPTADTARHHVIVAGTGRSGTSVLVKLLAACGLETALSPGFDAMWHDGANAGAETMLLAPGPHPYVVKSPWTYQSIQEILALPGIVIDRVVIPIRKLSDAAGSRIRMEKAAIDDLAVPQYESWSDFGITPGGVVFSLEQIDQERILARGLHLLLEALEERDVPYTFLLFPRFLTDHAYAYARLKDLFPALDRPAFDRAIASVARMDQVHMTGRSTGAIGPAAGNSGSAAPAGPRGGPAAAGAASPIVHDPDVAPHGFSHGNADIDGHGVHGWHWLTQYRPENDRYGFQVALSDTKTAVRYRVRIEGRWFPWSTLVTPPDGSPNSP